MKIHSQPMDLRDYFATAAMQGYCQNLGFYAIDPDVAKRAYEMADTMIAERESSSCESVDGAKQALIEAINRKYPHLEVSIYEAVDHLIFQLETGKPY